ncbi:MAG: GYD domain-containing protein [Candidatus Omnitrophica bacterium]|nr:GYD domain-containing protein [Candidatus Omnitrophota bacterium]
MAKFLMLGKYSAEAVKGMSAERTKKVSETIAGSGGKVDAMYATLGCHDLALIVDFPGTGEAMKASTALTKLTGIGFNTSPAVTVAEFDKLIG